MAAPVIARSYVKSVANAPVGVSSGINPTTIGSPTPIVINAGETGLLFFTGGANSAADNAHVVAITGGGTWTKVPGANSVSGTTPQSAGEVWWTGGNAAAAATSITVEWAKAATGGAVEFVLALVTGTVTGIGAVIVGSDTSPTTTPQLVLTTTGTDSLVLFMSGNANVSSGLTYATRAGFGTLVQTTTDGSSSTTDVALGVAQLGVTTPAATTLSLSSGSGTQNKAAIELQSGAAASAPTPGIRLTRLNPAHRGPQVKGPTLNSTRNAAYAIYTSATATPTGASATSAIGTASEAVSTAPSGLSTAATVGSAAEAVSIAPAALSALASVGTPAPAVSTAVAGVTGTTTVATPTSAVSSTVGGTSATSTVGSVTPAVAVALAGLTGTSTIGTPSEAVTTLIVGPTMAATVGAPAEAVTIAPAALSGLATIGTATPAVAVQPAGTTAASAVGTPVVSIASAGTAVPSGLTAVASTASATPAVTVAPAPLTMVASVASPVTATGDLAPSDATATPAGLTMVASVGTPTVTGDVPATVLPFAGGGFVSFRGRDVVARVPRRDAVATPQGLTMIASVGRPVAIGTVDFSDDELVMVAYLATRRAA